MHPRSKQLHPRSKRLHPRSKRLHPRSKQLHPRSKQLHPRSKQYGIHITILFDSVWVPRRPIVTGGFPSQRASNTENVSTSWRQQAVPGYQIALVFSFGVRRWLFPDKYQHVFNVENWLTVVFNDKISCNRLISQILIGTCSISHNARFRTEMCTFLFWIEHCGIWDSWILGFGN